MNDLLASLALTVDPENLERDSLIESTSMVATKLAAALAGVVGPALSFRAA